ncbi:hypothetical protein AAZX31_05G058400 [Glycine max]|uniref:DUF547 domain-containing protein n=1 Tax=Glycine max TaxID=3847 RepID=K7KN48_SOYBN|nr:uncharacterized protein LOC114412175 isoform X2 [Glycine soja]KAH1133033.1 hypothetical protein GYH30_011734 [Glycine max]KRH57426.1 hypothetical protein GLYMA_05G060400v4 [Glycine max]
MSELRGFRKLSHAAEACGYEDHGDSPHGKPPHRRSKSASERNLANARGGASHPLEKDHNECLVSTPSVGASRLQSPSYDNLTCVNKNTSSSHRASLEKDVEQLQLRLQQERSMRTLLERAMGRASSTLSPGHRHFTAQTKDLIAEIELLEEEVINREQQVLSLYRSIFEQCVSRSTSQQSSAVASPAHTKQGSRKHPSIISSAFCSSKKFPLRTLQALVSNNDLRNKIFGSNHAPLSRGKGNNYFKKTCSDSTKAHEKFSPIEKTPILRSLKDHLYQYPSKLSEDMVRCMATVYCWLRSATSVNSENVEISWISTHKRHSSHASYAIKNYRVLVEQLERVNVSQMDSDAQIAFWINVHNALVMHAYLAYGIPQGSLRRLALFHKAAYNIGGHIVSANAIEQMIFCFRTPRIGRWLESIVSAALRKKSGEERQLLSSKLGLTNSQPLVCFALCTGALSDPVLKVYSASNISEELNIAKREFLQANVIVKKSRKVFLPKLVERFSREASISVDDLFGWVMESVDRKLRDSMQKCLNPKSSQKPSQIIEWLPYSSRFRYVFSKDVIDKPWWV